MHTYRSCIRNRVSGKRKHIHTSTHTLHEKQGKQYERSEDVTHSQPECPVHTDCHHAHFLLLLFHQHMLHLLAGLFASCGHTGFWLQRSGRLLGVGGQLESKVMVYGSYMFLYCSCYLKIFQ